MPDNPPLTSPPVPNPAQESAPKGDELLTVSQVCARLPGARGARNVTPSTVTRWILKGCPSLTGRRVKLSATRAGSRWLIRPVDLDAFFAALKGDIPDASPSKPANPTAARRRAEAAGRELARRGA
jgi:hypothetical protein